MSEYSKIFVVVDWQGGSRLAGKEKDKGGSREGKIQAKAAGKEYQRTDREETLWG